MSRTVELGLVAVGGFVGAAARYGVGAAVPGAAGTLAVNVVGSFLLGVAVARPLPERADRLVGAGALSSFTAYSAFAVETVELGVALGALDVAATYLLGVGAALAGLALGGRAALLVGVVAGGAVGTAVGG